jgi:anti-sigma-K factor RskA
MTAMTDNIHLYAGAYALNALPVDERALFERHLASCEACQLEVMGYGETAARLGAATAMTPPAQLREQVLAAAATTRQISPIAVDSSRWSQRLRPYLAPVAASLAAIAIGLGGVSLYLNDARNDALEELQIAQTERELVQMLPNAAQVSMDAPEGVTARFVHSRTEDRGMLVVHGLGDLDPTQHYQLWLIHDGTPVPAGVFLPSGDNPVVFPAEAQVLGAELVAVTVEPAGGVPSPTGAILLSGKL